MKRIPPEPEITVERGEVLLILTNQAMIMEALSHIMRNLVGDLERMQKLRDAVDNTVKYVDKVKL